MLLSLSMILEKMSSAVAFPENSCICSLEFSYEVIYYISYSIFTLLSLYIRRAGSKNLFLSWELSKLSFSKWNS